MLSRRNASACALAMCFVFGNVLASPTAPLSPSPSSASPLMSSAQAASRSGGLIATLGNRKASTKPVCEVNRPLGASIDESRVNTFVHADVNGNDSNDGSSAQPVRTFCRALALANDRFFAGQIPKVIVRPGTYYGENCGTSGAPAYDGQRPYVIEGTEPGKVIISGSKPWTGWIGPDANGNWWKPWTNNWRQEFIAAGDGGLIGCTLQQDGGCMPEAVRRLELVHVDGQKYVPALSYSELETGTFFVNEAEDRLYVRPARGVDLNAPDRVVLVVEDRRTIFHIYSTLADRKNANLVLRNLTFAHTSGNGQPEWSNGSPYSHAVLIQNANNILIDNVTFLGNRLNGLGVGGNSITIRNSKFIDNGSLGLGAGEGMGLLVEDSEFRFNGGMVERFGWNGWASAGLKTACITESIFRRLKITDNATHGFWLDTAGSKVQLLDSLIANNARDGIFQENNNRISETDGDGSQSFCACQRPWTSPTTLTIKNTKIDFHNDAAGFFISESENTILDNVTLIGNQTAIKTYGVNCQNGTPKPLGPYYSGPCRGPMNNLAWQNSVIAATADSQELFGFEGFGGTPDKKPWEIEIFPFLKRDALYNTDNNRYFHPGNGTQFLNAVGDRTLDLNAWKALHATRQNTDGASVWEAPVFSTATGRGNGLAATYFSELNFGGTAVQRTDATVNFDLTGAAPAPGIGANNFSARWAGRVEAPATGVYTLRITGDDGIRLYLNGFLVANDWGTDHPPQSTEARSIYLAAGQSIDITLEFYQRAGGATARLEWKRPGQSAFEVIPQSQLYAGNTPPGKVCVIAKAGS
jgi:hypothetical protein